MRNFVNTRDRIVTEAIDGLLLSSSGGQLVRLDDPDFRVVLRADWDRDRVAIVSGGGSGHEPAHAGFVGDGMLTAAVCGELFASPSVDAVLAAILAVTGDAGCLVIVKNYTGDRLNFGLAAAEARARGFDVETVVVSDDVALPDAKQKRGIAGTILVHKIAGAAAAAGKPLEAVAAAARDAAASVRSLGLALSSCTMPGEAARDERVPADAAELGLGIHGEPGAETIAAANADALVTRVADTLRDALGPDRAPIALLVNALGAVPPIEMAVVMRAVARSSLADRIELVIGPAPFMTALDMRGFSLSVLPLDDERRRALLHPVAPSSWIAPRRFAFVATRPTPPLDVAEHAAPSPHSARRAVVETTIALLTEIAPRIDALDARVGDGDTGSTLAGGARAIGVAVETMPFADPPALLGAIADRLRRATGGSSGVLLAILFASAAASLRNGASMPRAFADGLARMKAIGGAARGDRTMIDALEPALDALLANGTLADAASAARRGADETAVLGRAGAGRSAYLAESVLRGHPDPGAEAVALLFERLAAADLGRSSGVRPA